MDTTIMFNAVLGAFAGMLLRESGTTSVNTVFSNGGSS
jgi:hypothetical protein